MDNAPERRAWRWRDYLRRRRPGYVRGAPRQSDRDSIAVLEARDREAQVQTMNPPRPFAKLLLVVALASLAACSVHTFRVTAANNSAEEYYVRARFDDSEVHVLRLPAQSETIPVFTQAGDLHATIDLLRPDCSVVGSWRDISGGRITVAGDGSSSFTAISDEEPSGSAFPEVAATEVPACGNTQFEAPTSTPTPTGSPDG
jgi:hypothetical protein